MKYKHNRNRIPPLLPTCTHGLFSFVFALAVLLFGIRTSTVLRAAGRTPNLIVILADDLGYGDLGCYGSRLNHTPNIDRLAAEGLRFTDFHSNGPMCTPTRAALLTGCYQQRFGRKFDGPLSGKTQRDEGLPLEAVTIAEVLNETGYATGMYGKWHLGYRAPYLPTRQGFDDFRGLTSGDGDHHSQIDRSGGEDWWNKEKIEMEEGYTTDLITRHSVEFIEQYQSQPFFLYVSHLGIHFPWQGPDDPVHRVKGRDYWNDKWGILPDPNDVSPHVKAMVEALDRSVGEIIAALQRFKLDQQTLVFFCSDNGGYLRYGTTHKNISSNGVFRGQKTQIYEGGHRVPAIAWWPRTIASGRTTSATAMTMDLFPTFSSLAGVETLDQRTIDGVNLLPLLKDNQEMSGRTLFWRMDEMRAARRGPWKLCMTGNSRAELYHLGNDPGETHDLSSEQTDIAASLIKEWNQWEMRVTSGNR